MALKNWHTTTEDTKSRSGEGRGRRTLMWLPSMLSRGDTHRRRPAPSTFSDDSPCTISRLRRHRLRRKTTSRFAEDTKDSDLRSSTSEDSALEDHDDLVPMPGDRTPPTPTFTPTFKGSGGGKGSTTHASDYSPQSRDTAPFNRKADTINGYSHQVLSLLDERSPFCKPQFRSHTDPFGRPYKRETGPNTYCELQSVVLELHRSSMLNQLAAAKCLRYDQFVANTTIEEILCRQKYDWARCQKAEVLAEVEKTEMYSTRDLLRNHQKRGNRRFVKKFTHQIPNEFRYWWEHLLFELLSYQLYTTNHDLSRLCLCTRQLVLSNVNSSIHLSTWKLPRESCHYCSAILRFLQAWQLDAISSRNEDMLASFELLVARPPVSSVSHRCGGVLRSRNTAHHQPRTQASTSRFSFGGDKSLKRRSKTMIDTVE